MKIGFPHMGNIYIAMETFLKPFCTSVITPPRPTRKSVEFGVRHCPEFTCFPMKGTLGDLLMALEMGADTLWWFEGAWSCRFGYYGRIQHQILKDMGYKFNSVILGGDLKTAIKDILRNARFKIPELMKYIRLSWYKSKLVELTENLSRKTTPYQKNPRETKRVADKAFKMIRESENISKLKRLSPKIESMFNSIPKDNTREPLKIWLMGEVYMVLEPEFNFRLVEYLGEHEVLVTPYINVHEWLFRFIGTHKRGENGENVAKKLAKPYLPYCLGGEGQNSIGYTILAKKRGYDGVIHLRPFTCMTENVAHPIIHNISQEYEIPVISFALDEHTENVGFFTRVEAFLELIHQRRWYR